MTEYWLQKKTLGGWSHVTWYSDWQQATYNYDKLRQGAGYSYRMVEVVTKREDLLEEVVEVEAPSLEPEAKLNVWAGQKPNGWTGSIGWGKPAINHEFLPGVEHKPAHGLAGKVWMIHHGKKEKTRIAQHDVETYRALGYEQGGPKTKFRD